MVPMLQCGLLRSNFALPMVSLSRLYRLSPSSSLCLTSSSDCLFARLRRIYFCPASPALLMVRLRRTGPGAGEGNRTLVISLEGCCSTIELHPPRAAPSLNSLTLAGRRDGGGGWIRTNVDVVNGFTVRPL